MAEIRADSMSMPDDRQQALRKKNLRLALILATIALVFGVGFVTKIAVFGF